MIPQCLFCPDITITYKPEETFYNGFCSMCQTLYWIKPLIAPYDPNPSPTTLKIQDLRFDLDRYFIMIDYDVHPIFSFGKHQEVYLSLNYILPITPFNFKEKIPLLLNFL